MIYIIGLGPNNSSNIKENIKNLLLENNCQNYRSYKRTPRNFFFRK